MWQFFISLAQKLENVLWTRVRPYISDLSGTTLRGKSSVSWIRGYLSFWNWTKFNRRSRRLKFTTIWDQMVSARELRPCNSGYCLQAAGQSYWPRMRRAREFILPGICNITWFSEEESLDLLCRLVPIDYLRSWKKVSVMIIWYEDTDFNVWSYSYRISTFTMGEDRAGVGNLEVEHEHHNSCYQLAITIPSQNVLCRFFI
jgi:hypothetical protein